MQKYIKALRNYCKQNPLNHGGAESVMEFLYWHYAENNPIDNQKIRNGFARCILPDILAYCESEEGQREFREWKARREAEQTEGKTGEKQ